VEDLTVTEVFTEVTEVFTEVFSVVTEGTEENLAVIRMEDMDMAFIHMEDMDTEVMEDMDMAKKANVSKAYKASKNEFTLE